MKLNPTKKTRPIVTTIADIEDGKAAAPHCTAAIPRYCTLCRKVAVLPLNGATRNKQPDATTHVCHPVLGGCNHGFTIYNEGGA